MSKKLISIVVPLHNEQDGVEKFHHMLLASLDQNVADYDFEIIYVNDGSKDNTLVVVSKIANNNKLVRLASLSKNVGKELALTAGIEISKGDAIITIDGDGQHPPKLINDFIIRWKEGADVVVGVRKINQKEGFIKRYGSKLFYNLFNSISETKLIPRSTDYRLISREVADEFLKFSHHHRITRGLIDWLGYDRQIIEFNANPRLEGAASYSTKKLLALAGNTFISLSFAPLKLFMYFGSIISFVALILGIFIIIEQFLMDDPLNLNVSSSGFLALLILMITGIILTCQGITSIYIAHMYYSVGNRPLYSISKKKSIRI